MISINGTIVTPTIFPDGTSQVWKLPEECLPPVHTGPTTIDWYYENEIELIHLNQLLVLLFHMNIKVCTLYVPYLPYGRQDKEVSNQSTFARKVFDMLLLVDRVETLVSLDIHSDNGSRWSDPGVDEYIDVIVSQIWDEEEFNYVFPDAGAKKRYDYLVDRCWTPYYLVMDKVRDQITGEITGLEISEICNLPSSDKFLIVDDICDGGRTFIETAKKIREVYPNAEICLYTTHGIYSKGLEPLFESGISRIFTTNSLKYFRMNSKFNFDRLEVLDYDNS